MNCDTKILTSFKAAATANTVKPTLTDALYAKNLKWACDVLTKRPHTVTRREAFFCLPHLFPYDNESLYKQHRKQYLTCVKALKKTSSLRHVDIRALKKALEVALKSKDFEMMRALLNLKSAKKIKNYSTYKGQLKSIAPQVSDKTPNPSMRVR